MEIVWGLYEQDSKAITKEEMSEIEQMLKLLMEKRPVKTVEWMEGFKSGRQFYKAMKEVMNSFIGKVGEKQVITFSGTAVRCGGGAGPWNRP